MLKVFIDRKSKKARFSGESTFAAKDQIKRIWSARWVPADKVWEASFFTDTLDELREKLFDFQLEIEEVLSSSIANGPAANEPEQSPEVPKGLSVPQIIFAVKAAVEERFRGGTLVYGVITSLKSSGNRTFLSLSDPEDLSLSLNCVFWDDLSKLNKQLSAANLQMEVGLEVMFHVELTVNSKNGNLSAKINRIIPEYTLAKLQGEREKTNQRLKEECLFDRNKGLAIPFLPKRIGILTSAGGTVIHDFMVVLEGAEFGFDLLWLPVSVQGAQAKDEIVRGLKTLGDRRDIDLIVLFRGGGSASDLSVFNNYEVARAICCCPLPVLSAIGHQEDQSSTQDVSNLAFGVPRDLGSFLAQKIIDARTGIQNFVSTFHLGLTNRFERAELELQRASHLLSAGGMRVFDRFRHRVIQLGGSLGLMSQNLVGLYVDRSKRLGGYVLSASQQQVRTGEEKMLAYQQLPERVLQMTERKERELSVLTAHVSEASPEVQMKRGYSIVRSGERFIKDAASAAKGMELSLEFIDGEVRADVVRTVLKKI